MDTMRIAVVGVGRIGLTHAENLACRVRGAELVAVTTSDEKRAAEARRVCGAIAVYEGLDELLAGEQLDAVCIASSTSAHADNVVQCAAAGLHVFCEKPLALSLEDCDRAISAASQAVRRGPRGGQSPHRRGRHRQSPGAACHKRRRGPAAAKFRRPGC